MDASPSTRPAEKGNKKKRTLEKDLADARSESTTVTGETLPPATPTAEKKRKVAEEGDKKAQKRAQKQQKAEEFRAEHGITLSGCEAGEFHPVYDFESTGMEESVMSICKGFQQPTPIQSQCWPIILANRDVVGIAATGSGKTLAFGLPALHWLLMEGAQAAKVPKALVLAPTRELAMQSQEVFDKAAAVTGARSVCLVGGVDKFGQIKDIRKGAQIIVATPGRLLGLTREGALSLSAVTYLVLDEADRMLDMGFEPDIRAIIAMLPPAGERQTVMFSATWPVAIRSLASNFLNQPVRINVQKKQPAAASAGGAGEGAGEFTDAAEMMSMDQTDGVLAASRSVTQHVELVEQFQKNSRLVKLLDQCFDAKRRNRIIIFALYKKEAERLETFLKGSRSPWAKFVQGVHGDKGQGQRTEAMAKFKAGEMPILVATDVAGRGLDIPDVEFVINVTFPLTVEDYVHRIGRTGRAGKKGTAYTFFNQNEKNLAGGLLDVMRRAGQEANCPEQVRKWADTCVVPTKKKKHEDYGDFYREVDMTQKGKQTIFEDDD